LVYSAGTSCWASLLASELGCSVLQLFITVLLVCMHLLLLDVPGEAPVQFLSNVQSLVRCALHRTHTIHGRAT
jgi:hypothetical protein